MTRVCVWIPVEVELDDLARADRGVSRVRVHDHPRARIDVDHPFVPIARRLRTVLKDQPRVVTLLTYHDGDLNRIAGVP